MRVVRLALTGFGNVGTGIATLLERHAEAWERQFDVRLVVTGVADRRGAAVSADGLDLPELLRVKQAEGTVAAAEGGQEGLEGAQFLNATGADILLETASTNFDNAEPGWSYVRDALRAGMDVVLASKGSLTLFWDELFDLARRNDRIVRYSGTVGSPLPSLDIIDRSLTGVSVSGFEALMNGTSNTILSLMAEGASYDEGVSRAQEIGIAETDPTLDVDGWDLAAKVVIVANTVLGERLELDSVERQGIRGVTQDDMAAAARAGNTIKLVGRAERRDGRIVARVAPVSLPSNHVLGRLQGSDMGIVFWTDLYGHVSATAESTDHQGALPTSMTVLRDVFNVARDRSWMAR